MKIFSFVDQAVQTAHNAAPVSAPPVPNPFGVHFGERPNPFRLVQQDCFQKDQPASDTAVIGSFQQSQAWLAAHTASELERHLDTLGDKAEFADLSEALGLLNAAHKTRKLRFTGDISGTLGDSLGYHRNFNEAVDAMRDGDLPAAQFYLRRARREISGFQGLKPEVQPASRFSLSSN